MVLKKNSEAQYHLIQAERMAALNMIAAGVAHEINNPLSFLLSNIESLQMYMKTFRDLVEQHELVIRALDSTALSPEVREQISKVMALRQKSDVKFILEDYPNLLNESLEGVSRISEIVQSLKAFSKPYGNASEPIDLNECVETAFAVLSNELKYKCIVQKRFSPIPKVVSNPGLMLQVFVNILLNAIQAISERGVVVAHTYLGEGIDTGFVVVAISDTGCGISVENKEHLFTPFYTTKPIGQGTGLGLSVSYGIVKELKGKIEVESEIGKGTTVFIKVPYEGGVK